MDKDPAVLHRRRYRGHSFIHNNQPVAFLMLEAPFLFIVFSFIIRSNSRRATVCKVIDGLYLSRLKGLTDRSDLVIAEFALVGIPAISGFAEGVLLGNVFGAFTTRRYQNSWNGWVYVGGNGSGGNSCGGGSSCGGGGGCGGCGGGH